MWHQPDGCHLCYVAADENCQNLTTTWCTDYMTKFKMVWVEIQGENVGDYNSLLISYCAKTTKLWGPINRAGQCSMKGVDTKFRGVSQHLNISPFTVSSNHRTVNHDEIFSISDCVDLHALPESTPWTSTIKKHLSPVLLFLSLACKADKHQNQQCAWGSEC